MCFLLFMLCKSVAQLQSALLESELFGQNFASGAASSSSSSSSAISGKVDFHPPQLRMNKIGKQDTVAQHHRSNE